MRAALVLPLAALLATTSGCYKTVVDTGRVPSRMQVRDEWVMGFAAGMVMPQRVDAARRCPTGVARVTTKASFANLVVQTVTAGILSPRTVEVTCAAFGPPGFGPGRGWGPGGPDAREWGDRAWGERRFGPPPRGFHHHHHR
jgi:hypothetical protein